MVSKNEAGKKLNAQKAGTTPLTDAQKAEVKAELTKTLGPKIKVAFEKIFGPIIQDKNGVRTLGPDGKPLREEWSGDQVDGLIRISITALDPLATSRHEASFRTLLVR